MENETVPCTGADLPLIEQYLEIVHTFNDLPNDSIQAKNETLVSILLKLQNIETRVRSEQLISKNEFLDDMNPVVIPFLSLTYHIGKVYSLLSTSRDNIERFNHFRIHNLERCNVFLVHFIRLCERVELVNKEEKKFLNRIWTVLDDDSSECIDIKRAVQKENPADFREFKIQSFKDSSHLQGIISRTSSTEREKAEAHLKILFYSALNDLMFNASEISLLVSFSRNKENPEKEETVVTKMKVMTIDSTNKTSMGTVSGGKFEETTLNDDFSGILGAVRGLESYFQAPKTRTEIQNEIFRPSWSLPTMSLEEFAEIERKRMLELEQEKADAKENPDLENMRMDGIKRRNLEDDEEIYDKATVNQRNWDDWKDENPRGSGWTKRF